ncbi:MAG: hypothetical protein EBW49_12020, partial [Betaproteobacteria bacterium]|nr:hypothetical protein [Betaproteobacteria bacterium]
MAFLPDGTMFFTEKCKGLSVRLPSGSVSKLLGVGGSSGYAATKNDLFCDGQAGVQGVAVDPDFAKNGFVYLYSSSKGSNRTYGGYNNIVMRMKVNSSLNGVSDIVEIINDLGYKPLKSNHPFGGPGAHNGGRVRFGPDGFLYVTIGDNHNGAGPQSPLGRGAAEDCRAVQSLTDLHWQLTRAALDRESVTLEVAAEGRAAARAVTLDLSSLGG